LPTLNVIRHHWENYGAGASCLCGYHTGQGAPKNVDKETKICREKIPKKPFIPLKSFVKLLLFVNFYYIFLNTLRRVLAKAVCVGNVNR